MKKTIIMMLMTIGSYGGSYVPMLWGVSSFSMTSIIFSGLGGFLGIYIGYKIMA
ncbi:hypothetical protein L6270_05540 [Candidatus Parcubacteria bacterium]|nr:hypothetical protein [Patescibacteria group bacterium]MBU4309422.1 hypothetical protein [Patescibacteria group bacterium]MBU4431979.1 hypothetical protein [Patescibacteria group bacterium]MBU4577783.1 hypothetical protein [Patescibacteria group bacterium]MCG2697468.1 hypothetical protein [Candidatus Parcubacteria bacterium]